jgi:xanthine/CO dehydrogenase XdhC/CoxF family maturation factor
MKNLGQGGAQIYPVPGNTHFIEYCAPIGLPIATETPEDIAISIMAEIVDTRRRKPKSTGQVITAQRKAVQNETDIS